MYDRTRPRFSIALTIPTWYEKWWAAERTRRVRPRPSSSSFSSRPPSLPRPTSHHPQPLCIVCEPRSHWNTILGDNGLLLQDHKTQLLTLGLNFSQCFSGKTSFAYTHTHIISKNAALFSCHFSGTHFFPLCMFVLSDSEQRHSCLIARQSANLKIQTTQILILCVEMEIWNTQPLSSSTFYM